MSQVIAFVDVVGVLEETGGVFRYVLVFLLAMVPVVEPFVVIPVGIGLGLDPVATGFAAFAGSVTAVGLIIGFQHRLVGWWRQRSGNDGTHSSGRAGRASRVGAVRTRRIFLHRSDTGGDPPRGADRDHGRWPSTPRRHLADGRTRRLDGRACRWLGGRPLRSRVVVVALQRRSRQVQSRQLSPSISHLIIVAQGDFL